MVSTDWEYSGDVNLKHGGLFYDLSTFQDGYCSAVRVTDLDSGCGFDGAVMVEHIVVCGTKEKDRIAKALECYGIYLSEIPTKHGKQSAIVEALVSYGHYDPDDSWDNYQSHHIEILQLDSDGPMKFDGWKADKRLHNTNLEEYIRSVHLR